MRAAWLLCALGAYAVQAADPTKPHSHQGIESPFTPGVRPSLTEQEKSALERGETVFSQDRSGRSARVVAVQDVAAPPAVVWDRILDFRAYPKMVPLVIGCDVLERRALKTSPVIPAASEAAVPTATALPPGQRPWWCRRGLGGDSLVRAVSQPYAMENTLVLPRALASGDFGGSLRQAVGSAKASLLGLRPRAGVLMTRSAAAESETDAPDLPPLPTDAQPDAVRDAPDGMTSSAIALPQMPKQPEEILVKLTLRLGIVKCTNYLEHQFYPSKNSLTWTLDYGKASDFVENVGHWHVVQLEDGKSRVFYSCVPHLPRYIPKPLVDVVANRGLQLATAWVKRESEAQVEDEG